MAASVFDHFQTYKDEASNRRRHVFRIYYVVFLQIDVSNDVPWRHFLVSIQSLIDAEITQQRSQQCSSNIFCQNLLDGDDVDVDDDDNNDNDDDDDDDNNDNDDDDDDDDLNDVDDATELSSVLSVKAFLGASSNILKGSIPNNF